MDSCPAASPWRGVDVANAGLAHLSRAARADAPRGECEAAPKKPVRVDTRKVPVAQSDVARFVTSVALGVENTRTRRRHAVSPAATRTRRTESPPRRGTAQGPSTARRTERRQPVRDGPNPLPSGRGPRVLGRNAGSSRRQPVRDQTECPPQRGRDQGGGWDAEQSSGSRASKTATDRTADDAH